MRQSINSDQYSLNISQILSAFTEEFLKQEDQDQQIMQLDSVISNQSASNNDLLSKIVEGVRFFEDYKIDSRSSREELGKYTEQLLKLLSLYHDYLLSIIDPEELDSEELDHNHITSIKSLVGPNGHFYRRLLDVKIDDFSKLVSTVKNITFLFNKLILDFEKAKSMAPDQLKSTVEKISLTLNIFPGNVAFACFDGLQSSLISTIKSLNPKSTLEKIVQEKFYIHTSQVASIVPRGDERHCQPFLIDVLSLKDHSATLRKMDSFYINPYYGTKLALIFSIFEDLSHHNFFAQLLIGYQKYYDELPDNLREANILEEFELLTTQQLQKLNNAIETVKDNFSSEDCEEFGLNTTFSFFNSDDGTIMTPQQVNQKLIKDICKKHSEKYPHFFDQEKVDFFKYLPSKKDLFYSQDSDYLDPGKMSILFELFQRIKDSDEPEIKKEKLDKVASGLFLLREIIKNHNTFDISQPQHSVRSRIHFYCICFFSNFQKVKGFGFLELFYKDGDLSKIRDEYQQLSPILDFFKKEILKIEKEERLIRNLFNTEEGYSEFKEIFLQGNYSEKEDDSKETIALKQQKRERFRRFATSKFSPEALLSLTKMLVDSGNAQALGELGLPPVFLSDHLESKAIYNQEIIKTLCQFFCAGPENGVADLTELKSILINADPNVFETALSIKRADVAEDLLTFLEQDICNPRSEIAVRMLNLAFEYEKPNLVRKILEILTKSQEFTNIPTEDVINFFATINYSINYRQEDSLIDSLILTNNIEGLEVILKFLPKTKRLDILKILNQNQETPLILAASFGNKNIVKMLLENGADVNLGNNIGATALHFASEHGHREVVELLLGNGANINLADKEGATALHTASEEGYEKVVALLLERRAKVDLTDKDGTTALHVASINGHREVVALLLEKGAKVDLTNKDGTTALHVASIEGHQEIVELLLENGANVNLAGKEGITALHLASVTGHREVVRVLLEKEANVNLADEEGLTPLHFASEKGDEKVVALLLEKGANINLADKKGLTPLHIASKNGHREVVELLLENGANIDLADKKGVTALHLDSRNGHREIVELLLRNGANVNLADKNGKTALHLASRNGHTDIVRILEFFSNLRHSPNSEGALKLFGEKVDFMKDLEKSIKRDQSTSDLTTASEINAYKQELEKQLITRLALLKLYSYAIGTNKFPDLSKEQKIEIIELGSSQLHSYLRDFYDLIDNPDLKAIIDKTPQELIILAKQISTKITDRIASDGNSVGEFSEDRAWQDATEILRNICRKSLAPSDLEISNSLISEIVSEIVQQQNPSTNLLRANSSRFGNISYGCVVS